MASHFAEIVRAANKDGTPARPSPAPAPVSVHADPEQSELRRALLPFDGLYEHVQGRMEIDKSDVAIALTAAGVAVRLADLLQ